MSGRIALRAQRRLDVAAGASTRKVCHRTTALRRRRAHCAKLTVTPTTLVMQRS